MDELFSVSDDIPSVSHLRSNNYVLDIKPFMFFLCPHSSKFKKEKKNEKSRTL